METNLNELLETVSKRFKEIASTDTVVGEEFTMGEYTCKPVIKLGMGFGSGTGTGKETKLKNKGESTGAGGGVGIAPVGFLVTKGNEISFIPASNKKGLDSLLEKAPGIIEKIMEMKEGKKEEQEEKKENK